MAAYSYAQLMGLAVGAGFPVTLAPIMAAIAEAESSGNATAVNVNTNGTRDEGLWQINDANATYIQAAGGNRFDPAENAAMAYAIYRHQGLHAWTTYTSGAYRSHLVSGVAPVPVTGTGAGAAPPVTAQDVAYTPAVAQQVGYTGQAAGFQSWLQKNWKQVLPLLTPAGIVAETPTLGAQAWSGTVGSVQDAVSGVGNELSSVGHLAAELTSVKFWQRVGMFAAGVAVLVFGIYLWNRQAIDRAAGTVAGVASKAAVA